MSIEDENNESFELDDADLQKMTKKSLVEICKSKEIKKTGSKNDIIVRIMKHQDVCSTTKERIREALLNFESTKKENGSKRYKENFNMVDRLDVYWNQTDYHIRMED